MVLYHRIEWRSGGPAWSVDVPGAGSVGCSVRVVSVSRESLHRGSPWRSVPPNPGRCHGQVGIDSEAAILDTFPQGRDGMRAVF